MVKIDAGPLGPSESLGPSSPDRERERERERPAMAKPAPPAFVYRISAADEWTEFQRTGTTLGGDLDRSTGCIHLSDLSQVR